MTTNFDLEINRRDSDSVKWNRYPSDVLPLWVADMDFASPQPVINAIKKRCEHQLFGYSFPQEITKESICSWLERRHNWSVSPNEIILFPGVVPALNHAALAFTNPGDSILIHTPAYHPFFDLSSNANISLRLNPLLSNSGGRYEINIEDFYKQIHPTTRLFILCNPHNPSGRVFSNTELTQIANACLENNILICSDEIHSDLVYPPNQHVPIASISDEIAQSTITLISPSKTFNLAGLKAAAVIIKNDHLREIFIKRASGLSSSVNILGETAMLAAYSYCDDWLDELLVYLDKNCRFLVNYVNKELPGVSMKMPEGTYLGWLDFSDSLLDSPSTFLLERAQVALNSGDWFGQHYSKYARINFGCPMSTLKIALDRIKSALNSP